jgi:GT2 family glycosyltransferase
VLVKHEPEATISQVRNALGEEATGDWLCFLDADDELAQGYLSTMTRSWDRVRRHGKVPLVLLTPQVSYVQPHGKRLAPKHHRRGNLHDDNFLVVGTLVQRELFLRVGGFEDYPHGYEDWSLWAKCWKEGAQIVQVVGAVYVAYVNPDSKRRTAWRDHKLQLQMHHKIREELFPELYKA